MKLTSSFYVGFGMCIQAYGGFSFAQALHIFQENVLRKLQDYNSLKLQTDLPV